MNCTFVGGQGTSGGNLHIIARGSPYWSGVSSDNTITIINSTFIGGIGGNLLAGAYKDKIYNNATVQIKGSKFIGAEGKGGAVVAASGSVNVTDCQFENNKEGADGGGLSVVSGGPLPSMIEENTFISNEGIVAGGLSVPTYIGSLPSLYVLNNVFEDNIASVPTSGSRTWGGGAVYVNVPSWVNEVTLSGNQGSGNSNANGASTCGDISLRLPTDSNNPICAVVDVEFSS